jgi:hypothetical protein
MNFAIVDQRFGGGAMGHNPPFLAARRSDRMGVLMQTPCTHFC